MAAGKEKKSFRELNDADMQVFMDYTGISLRQAKEIFQKLDAEIPNGNLNRSQFADFFKKIDPDSCKLDNYAQFTDMIFRSFDSDKDDFLTVKETLIGFAVITKGDMEKRLEYIFNLYDSDCNGSLSKEEIKDGFKGVFIMGGVDANDFVVDVSANNKMKKLDSNQDGKITKGKYL
jgi:Ca2+-binding EF-hand superfamily protein